MYASRHIQQRHIAGSGHPASSHAVFTPPLQSDSRYDLVRLANSERTDNKILLSITPRSLSAVDCSHLLCPDAPSTPRVLIGDFARAERFHVFMTRFRPDSRRGLRRIAGAGFSQISPACARCSHTLIGKGLDDPVAESAHRAAHGCIFLASCFNAVWACLQIRFLPPPPPADVFYCDIYISPLRPPFILDTSSPNPQRFALRLFPASKNSSPPSCGQGPAVLRIANSRPCVRRYSPRPGAQRTVWARV